MSLSETPRCYALRRINPFLGVLQVLEADGGRAVSANGVVWEIELTVEAQGGWGSLNRHNRQLAYCSFGLWSREEGLLRRPLAPFMNRQALEEQALALTAQLQASLEALPFPLLDRRELWLYDQAGEQPIALLASMGGGQPRPSPEPRSWSAAVGTDGVPSQRRFPRAAELEAQIKQRAGFNINKYWISRREDGSGLLEVRDREMPAEAFPPFLLSEVWDAPEQAELVRQYIAWTAPGLLTLQHLTRQQRHRLEQSLHIQAESVEHHWHLYPETIDDRLVKSARVQCRLQQANQ